MEMKTILTDDVNVDGGLKLKVCIITEFYTYLLLNYEFFVQDQPTKLDFYSASSLKQLSVGLI
jgi:hypothetical protein